MPKSSKKSRSSKKSKSSRSKTAYRFSVHVKKSPRKSLKRSSRKSSKKSKSKATPWLAHVKAVYKEGLKKDKDYKFAQALKDAKKSYKK